MDWSYFEMTLLPLVASALLGGLLGLERELAGRWAGLRTHMLVALGAAMFMVVGSEVTKAVPSELSRIIQGVATGIGFIGAGTILKLSSQERVSGLTTASSIWAAAAIGIGVGLRMYAISVTATVIALFILKVLTHAEKKIDVLDKKNGDGG